MVHGLLTRRDGRTRLRPGNHTGGHDLMAWGGRPEQHVGGARLSARFRPCHARRWRSRSRAARSAGSPGGGCTATRSRSRAACRHLLVPSRSCSLPIAGCRSSANACHQDLIDPSATLPRRLRRDELGAPAGRGRPDGRDILTRISTAPGSRCWSASSPPCVQCHRYPLGIIAGFFGGWVDTRYQPAHGHVPGLPAAAVRHRPLWVIPDEAFGLSVLAAYQRCWSS